MTLTTFCGRTSSDGCSSTEKGSGVGVDVTFGAGAALFDAAAGVGAGVLGAFAKKSEGFCRRRR
ncbi:MAG: hypothetical protein ACI4RE_04805 [Christensenellales bacterium]